MQQFDFHAPAEVFVGAGRLRRRQPMTYKRFGTGAEAIRHVIEGLSAEVQGGAVVETEDMRLSAAEIRELYDSPEFPLPRRQKEGGSKP